MNLNALRTPYDNIRPKSFFAARKLKLNEEKLTADSGKSYNPLWAKNKMGSAKKVENQNADINELKLILPWVLFLTMAIANLLILL